MRVGDSWRKLASSDLGVLVLWAIAGVLLHAATNGQYGFHHDELATLDDARSLAWGYVAYPPLTPFLARIAFILVWTIADWAPFLCSRGAGPCSGAHRSDGSPFGRGKAGTNRGSVGCCD